MDRIYISNIKQKIPLIHSSFLEKRELNTTLEENTALLIATTKMQK